MLSYTYLAPPNIGEGGAPKPPHTPGLPVERHPANDDWGVTMVAIIIMSVMVFAVLGILVKQSFRLVPTGVMALRTIVNHNRSSAGYHSLPDDGNAEGEEDIEHSASGAPSSEDRRRLELLSDSETEEDARVLHIRTSD
ncbi:hypothetical protein GGI12_005034 [Dipsacomyces acuminosporus]|nr:hypothetical protein GGI12_005034 [Dipsacomyces acuminosporus]